MELNQSQNEFTMYSDLQSKLLSLDEDNIEKLNNFFVFSIYQTESEMKLLSHNILLIIDTRPQKIIILINFIQYLTNSTSYKNLPELIFFEIIKTEATCSRLFFLYQLLRANLIPEDLILAHIQSCNYFSWFAPLIEEKNLELFEYFMNQNDENLLISCSKSMKDDKWKLHKQYASEGMNHNEVAALIRDDDIEKLREISDFDMNISLPMSPFESIDILNHGCTPLHYAIYFNSEKCYDDMLENGASPFSTDFNGFDAVNFAIAGECFSFLEKFLLSSFCEDRSIFETKIKQAIQSSIKYHQNSLFDSLMLQYSEFSDVCSIFLTASMSDNASIILKCIENKVDVNCVDNCKESALIIASKNNHIKLVEFLLSLPEIDPSLSDAFGRNALICAVDKCNIEIVKILIKDDRIDINSFDKKIFILII